MAVENPTVVQEAPTASHEWKTASDKVAGLLAQILERLPQAADAEGNKPREVEIQLGKQKLFRGVEGEVPKRDILTEPQISTLEKLLDTPSTSDENELSSSVKTLGGKVLTIKVDREPVLRIADGQLNNDLGLPKEQASTLIDAIEPLGHETLGHVEPLGHETLSQQNGRDFPAFVTDLSEVNQELDHTADSQTPDTDSISSNHNEQSLPNVESDINSEPELNTTSESITEKESDQETQPMPVLSVEAAPVVEEPSQEVSQNPPESKDLVVSQQVELGPTETTAPKSLGEVIMQDLANSFDLPPETREYFKETGAAIRKSAQSLWASLKVKAKDAAISGVQQAKFQLQSRQAANMALQLLNSDPEGRRYAGDDYTITALNRRTISVTDAEQKEILRFEETPLGPKILSSDLTPKQLKEFAQIKGQLHKHGSEVLLNNEPPKRLQFLQGFAPTGDRAYVQAMHNEQTVTRVEQITNALKPTASHRGVETHNVGEYVLSRKGNDIDISHRERGVILSRKDGQIQGTLTDHDIAHFKGISTRVEQLYTLDSVPPAATATASNTVAKRKDKDIELGE